MRYFILDKINKRFKGDKVLDVAKKAAKYIFSNTTKITIKFCIRETTKKSKHKSYKYIGKKINSNIYINKIINNNKIYYGSAKKIERKYQTSILKNIVYKKVYKFEQQEAIEKNKIFKNKLIDKIKTINNTLNNLIKNNLNIEEYFKLINYIAETQEDLKNFINNDGSYEKIDLINNNIKPFKYIYINEFKIFIKYVNDFVIKYDNTINTLQHYEPFFCNYDERSNCTKTNTNFIGLNNIYIEACVNLIYLINFYICEYLTCIMLYNKDQQIQTSIRNFFLKNNYKFILSHDNDININTKRFFSNVLRIIAFPLNFLALLVMINPKALTIPFIIHDATNLNKNNKFLEHQQNYKKNII